MVSIILSASDEAKARALKAGFREETVLIRFSGGLSTAANKQAIERELRRMLPNQFLVSDYWGVGRE